MIRGRAFVGVSAEGVWRTTLRQVSPVLMVFLLCVWLDVCGARDAAVLCCGSHCSVTLATAYPAPLE